MGLVLYLDSEGVAKVEIVSTEEDGQEGRRLFSLLRSEIEALDDAVKRCAAGMREQQKC